MDNCWPNLLWLGFTSVLANDALIFKPAKLGGAIFFQQPAIALSVLGLIRIIQIFVPEKSQWTGMRLTLIDNKFCNFLSECWLKMLCHNATFVNGDYNITSNSVAKLTMPLQLQLTDAWKYWHNVLSVAAKVRLRLTNILINKDFNNENNKSYSVHCRHFQQFNRVCFELGRTRNLSFYGLLILILPRCQKDSWNLA